MGRVPATVDPFVALAEGRRHRRRHSSGQYHPKILLPGADAWPQRVPAHSCRVGGIDHCGTYGGGCDVSLPHRRGADRARRFVAETVCDRPATADDLRSDGVPEDIRDRRRSGFCRNMASRRGEERNADIWQNAKKRRLTTMTRVISTTGGSSGLEGGVDQRVLQRFLGISRVSSSPSVPSSSSSVRQFAQMKHSLSLRSRTTTRSASSKQLPLDLVHLALFNARRATIGILPTPSSTLSPGRSGAPSQPTRRRRRPARRARPSPLPSPSRRRRGTSAASAPRSGRRTRCRSASSTGRSSSPARTGSATPRTRSIGPWARRTVGPSAGAPRARAAAAPPRAQPAVRRGRTRGRGNRRPGPAGVLRGRQPVPLQRLPADARTVTRLLPLANLQDLRRSMVTR